MNYIVLGITVKTFLIHFILFVITFGDLTLLSVFLLDLRRKETVTQQLFEIYFEICVFRY